VELPPGSVKLTAWDQGKWPEGTSQRRLKKKQQTALEGVVMEEGEYSYQGGLAQGGVQKKKKPHYARWDARKGDFEKKGRGGIEYFLWGG